MKPINQLLSDFNKLASDVNRFIQKDAPKIAGKEAVDHFRDSFQNEGFTDANLEKWKDVKRRDATSKWYGFDYKGEKRDKKTGKTTKSKKQKQLNFSQAATSRKSLPERVAI
jgi:hypothetical protein